MLFLEIPLTAAAVHGAMMLMSHTGWQRLENLETETETEEREAEEEEEGKLLRERGARAGIG